MKSISLNKQTIFILLTTATLIFFLPIIFNNTLILGRDNDLTEQFWPNFYYIKNQVLQHHTLPLWNNMFLSGTPLLPDPQAGLFYPPHVLFLLLPIDKALIILLLLHTLLGGLAMYLLIRFGFNLSKLASLLAATAYIFSPKLAGYLEAGHYGLAVTTAWLPFALLAMLMINKKPQLGWTILLSVSLAALLYSHPIMFAISILLILVIWFGYIRGKLKATLLLVTSLLLTLGLTAITLLPQLEWSHQTTRYLLLENREVFPVWKSIQEILVNSLFPWTLGQHYLWDIDPEKWIPLGIILSSLALIGLINFSNKLKIIIVAFCATILLIIANNSSPLYSFLLSQDWYVLMRVSTRTWFLLNLVVTILAAFGLDFLWKKSRPLSPLLITICLLELLFISWSRLLSPISIPSGYADEKVYTFLKQHNDLQRVFCISRCISQKKASQLNLQLVEGYNPMIQSNYNQQAWQLTGAYWKNYTHTIPPIGSYTFEKLQPDPVSLGEYNTKYIISKYPLSSNNFTLIEQIDQFFIYQNNLLKPRSYFSNAEGKLTPANITYYSPNRIIIDTSNKQSYQLILSEVYSKGWKAYLDGKAEVPVQETPSRLRLVDIKPNTNFVVFSYQPRSFEIGKWITLLSAMLSLVLLKFRKYVF